VFKLGQYFIMAYRDSIGDISVPGYSKWMEKYEDNQTGELN